MLVQELLSLFKTLKPQDVQEFHRFADKNMSRESIHHTLGTGPFQAAAGNHTHFGGRNFKPAKSVNSKFSVADTVATLWVRELQLVFFSGYLTVNSGQTVNPAGSSQDVLCTLHDDLKDVMTGNQRLIASSNVGSAIGLIYRGSNNDLLLERGRTLTAGQYVVLNGVIMSVAHNVTPVD